MTCGECFQHGNEANFDSFNLEQQVSWPFTMKIHQVLDKAIRLSLFPFSLAGKAMVWLNSLLENSLTDWEEIVAKFLNNYFPQSKVNKGKQEILSF